MAVLWILCNWICAVIFTGIGIYASKTTKPMSFWSGTTVLPETIRDIPAYNKENSRMWLLYASSYWISGAVFWWNEMLATILLGLACSAGIVWLIWHYKKIERKYKRK